MHPKILRSLLIATVLVFLGLLFSAFVSSAGFSVENDFYSVSVDNVNRSIAQGTMFKDFIEIGNLKEAEITVSFSLSGDADSVIIMDDVGFSVAPGNKSLFYFTLRGKELGGYDGVINIKGDIIESIPIHVEVVAEETATPFLVDVEPFKKSFTRNEILQFHMKVNKLNPGDTNNVSFSYYLEDSNNQSFLLGSEVMNITNSFQELKSFELPEEAAMGNSVFSAVLKSGQFIIDDKSSFVLKRSFFHILVFGVIPMWLLITIITVLIAGILAFYFIRKHIESKKKYKMSLDLKTLPKKNDEFLYLGKIAEKNIDTYLDPARLTTHSIVAGATGGGKSISAQVIIEEALMKNIAVIVFDPTAQWSGMLRRCTDKKMMSYYPKFGLKESDAKAFKGNVRQVTHARQLIDINKFIFPGQIQIFSLNKLDAKDMDLFVSNVIRQIFKSDPKEAPTLKVLLVFDEVHRLLSKFGGSGEGFLQVERACREFRKWGIGVMLVSQVLSDFVGEIKANISTEVQMRTRDEGDLNRIKTKYGEEFLQSLVKASVGVGMFVNPAYNHARPYFINFRPILHNTRRLPDEELEKYNKYNDMVDDLEFQIDELEKEKVDVFDLRMELKLVKDKVMSGSFSVVDIYLEGLKPRVGKAWEELGKKPPERKIELVSEAEIQKSVAEAKASREKFEKTEKAKEKSSEGEKEVKEEEISKKELAPLTFDNGIMVSSIGELLGALPTMDDEIFSIHVNENKNDIASWISKNISEGEGSKLKSILAKQDMIAALGKVGKKESKEEGKKKPEAEVSGKAEQKETKASS